MGVILADLRATVTAAKPGNLTASIQSLQVGIGMGLSLGLGLGMSMGMGMGGAGRSPEEVRAHTYSTWIDTTTLTSPPAR